jgi:peptidoglycan hydrolase FlgJ
MAIQPPSDIILDVARNADSSREAAAIRRLEGLAAAGDASGGNFTSTLDRLNATRPPSGQALGVAPAVRAQYSKASVKSVDRSAQVAQDFEASLLGPMINEMMPKEASAVYGQGVAGDVWKSMLAEQIAHHLAKSGTLGLARRLFSTHPIENLHGHLSSHTSAAEAAQRAAQASSQPLSLPTGADPSVGGNLAGSRRS